jgi:hypothetical protein
MLVRFLMDGTSMLFIWEGTTTEIRRSLPRKNALDGGELGQRMLQVVQAWLNCKHKLSRLNLKHKPYCQLEH